MDNLREHMRLSLVWTAFQQWGVQAVRMAVLLVLARLITPAAFGVFAFASTIVNVAQLFCHQGMTAALFQRRELDDRHIGAAFASMFFASCLCTLLLIISAPLFLHLLPAPDLVPLLRLLSWSLPLNALSGVAVALWRRHLNFQRIALVTTTCQLLASAAALALAFKGFGIWALALRLMAEAVLTVLLTCTATPWKLLLPANYRAYSSGYRDMARVAFPIAGVNLLMLGRNRVDELLIGAFLGAEALGYYALARRQIDGIAALVPVVIGNALMPILSRIQHDLPRVKIVAMRGIGILGALTLPAFVGIGAAASTWVPLLLGPRWLPSVPVIQGLAIVYASRSIVGFSLSVLFATGHAGKRFLFELLMTVVSLVITLAALPWGVNCIAFSCAVGMVLLMPLELHWLSRWTSVTLHDQLHALRGPLLAAVLLFAIILLLQTVPGNLFAPVLRLALVAISTALILLISYRRVPPLAVPELPTQPS